MDTKVKETFWSSTQKGGWDFYVKEKMALTPIK
jgi:hypothetical protein